MLRLGRPVLPIGRIEMENALRAQGLRPEDCGMEMEQDMSDGSTVFREFEKQRQEALPENIDESRVRLMAVEADRDSIDARLVDLEQCLPEATAIVSSLAQLGQTVQQLHQQVVFLSQQRAVAEQQLERHTRATALDLAIKAAPGAAAGAMTELADAFVGWLKGGAN